MSIAIVGAAGMLLGILLAWIVAWIALRDRPGRPSHTWEIHGYRPWPSAEPQGSPPTGGSGLLPPPPGPTPPDFEGSAAARAAATARWREEDRERRFASARIVRRYVSPATAASWDLDDRLCDIEARLVEIVDLMAGRAQEKKP